MTVWATAGCPTGSASCRPVGSNIDVTRWSRFKPLKLLLALTNWIGAFSPSTAGSTRTDEMYLRIMLYEGSSGQSWDTFGPMPQLKESRRFPTVAGAGEVRATRMIELSGRFLPQS